MEGTEERISELEDRAIEITQSEWQKENSLKENKAFANRDWGRGLWDANKDQTLMSLEASLRGEIMRGRILLKEIEWKFSKFRKSVKSIVKMLSKPQSA